jgi:RNA polymerase sigma-70 factor (ECF subfamily)
LDRNDNELIKETLSGALPSFDELILRYEKLTFKIALSFGKTKENAMDITQNVFLKAYQNLHSFRGKSPFKAWLMKITYNEGINWTRKNKHYQNQDIFEEELMIDNHSPSQEDELLAKEYRSQLLRSLFALNTKYRLAVVLRYFEDMPIREIAGAMKCSEGVVKNMLYRSLQRLKVNLQANTGGYNETL